MGHRFQAGYKNSVQWQVLYATTKMLTSKNDRFVPPNKIISVGKCWNSVKKTHKTHALLLYLRVRWTELVQGQKKVMKTLHYAEML